MEAIIKESLRVLANICEKNADGGFIRVSFEIHAAVDRLKNKALRDLGGGKIVDACEELEVAVGFEYGER